jgi:outer membrane protein OmpA-like peptidoglycan-associated protein
MPSESPRLGRALATLATAAVLALAPAASAQTTFAVDRLIIAGAPGDGIAVWRPDVAEKTRFFGQLGLGLSVNPLRVDNYVDNLNDADKIKGNPLATQFITYLNVGAEILNRVSIQVSFPFVAYQASTLVDNSSVQLPLGVKTVAPGDLRIEGRVVLFRNEARSFKLALNGAAFIPTGNRFSFAGDAGAGALFGLAAEYDARVVAVVLNAGYRLRPTVALNELVVSSELIYGIGAYVPLRKGTIRLGAELFGGVGASPATLKVHSTPPATRSNVGDLDTSPLEWMLNGRMYFTAKRQVYAGLGAGTRLTGGYAPDFRGVALVGGSFGLSDSDPGSPGGRYVFETSDPLDTDHDGIPDEVDACPLEPGEMDSDPDKIGCPRYIRRIKGSNEIEVLKRIEFEFDKSNILPVSFPILDEVVNLLQANPTIKHMRIEGHTDNQGSPEYNQKLSDDRADSVMQYLIKKGIAAVRLDAKGFGLTKPRATNDTDDGRQKNRRVEFHITEQIGDALSKPVPPPGEAPKKP